MADVTVTPSEAITYSVYPQYEQVERVCGNCKHWDKFSEGWGECNKPINDNLISIDGLLDTQEGFGCILFEAKESESMGDR